uniref:Chitin-binding type-2 domain-containing protein n=1 Tax=Anopheles maculatus TaxID=74869 RepID=A0A182SM52_9DIPT
MCCPDGMYFNPDTQLCDDETNVDCQIEPPACETTTNSPDTTTTTSAEETPTQDPDISTTTDTTTTTSDTDTTTQESTTTEDTTSTAAVETTTVQEGVDLAALCAAQPTDSLVELAFPGECSMYVMCENRELVATELCPAGLHFNPILSVCDSPDHAECLEFVCQDNPVGSQVALASLNSCQRYFICIGNVTVERFCAPGTIYEAENEWCIVDDLENPCEVSILTVR